LKSYYYIIIAMLLLSRSRVRARTSRIKTWSAHYYFFQKCFTHISYTSFQIQIIPGKMMHKSNLMRTQTLKISGNIGHIGPVF